MLRHRRKRTAYRFATGGLLPGPFEDDGCVASCTQAMYQETLRGHLEAWPADGTVDEKWVILKTNILASAECAIGRQHRRQPDWYLTSAGVLEPLFHQRQLLHRRWLSSRSTADYSAFSVARRRTRAAVRSAKDCWLKSKADFVEADRFSSRGTWTAIRDIQRCFTDLHPRPVTSIRDEEGNPRVSVDDQCARWHRHVIGVLNLPSQYNATVVEAAPQREVDILNEPPSIDDLCSALRSMSTGKSGGLSGIVPELLKAGGECLRAVLLDLLRSVWVGSYVPPDWRHAQIIPIPKKGSLSSCDNWRGITLLDVVGKLCGRIVQNRLRTTIEAEIPETQCGFRAGRGCPDAVFCGRQLVEKAFEHRTKIYLLFIDLRVLVLTLLLST